MEMVHEAVQKGCEQQRRGNDKNQPGIQRKKPRKQLSAKGLRRVDRPHTTQEHGRVEKGVDPRQPLKRNVTNHTHPQRTRQQCRNPQQMRDQPVDEMGMRDGCLAW